jgi:hypothetical protein
VGAKYANLSGKSSAGKSYVLLALMRILSAPRPALNTSMPPLPVRVSLPAPATKISSRLVPVNVLASAIPVFEILK